MQLKVLRDSMSTKNLLLYLLIFFCPACSNTMLNSAGNKTGVLHARLAVAAGVEPLAFFQNKGLYQLYYSSPSGAGTGKGFRLARTTSKDLVHWTEKEITLPPGMKPSILQGGMIIDSNNISGYGTPESPPILALLTRTDQQDSIKSTSPLLAFSTDGGDLWTLVKDEIKLPNVLIENPQHISILWFAPTSKWIMTVALQDHLEFFSSADLRTWEFESKLGTDFFPEDVSWNRSTLFLSADNKTWVLLADIQKTSATRTSGGTVYFAGDFDGHQFVNRSAQLHWLDYGEDIYGSLLAITSDGRRINMAWKNRGEQGTTLLPRELTLQNLNGESFIRISPLQELNKLYSKEVNLPARSVTYKRGNQELISGVSIPLEIFLKFNTSNIQKGSFPTRVGVSLSNNSEEHLAFGYDRFGFYYLDTSGLITSGVTPIMNSLIKMPYDHTDSSMDLHIIVDSSTIECFAEGGKLVMTSSYSSSEPFDMVKLFALNGNIEFEGGKIIELDPLKK